MLSETIQKYYLHTFFSCVTRHCYPSNASQKFNAAWKLYFVYIIIGDFKNSLKLLLIMGFLMSMFLPWCTCGGQ